jgi:uncharacterized protein (DUF305 family)
MRWILVPVFAVAFGAAIAGCAVTTSAISPEQARETPMASPTPSAQEIDRAFVSAMVSHHAAAIGMARVEVQRGRRAEVKQLAQQIIDEQEREITELQQIARVDFRFTPSSAVPTGVQQGVLMGQPILMNFQQQIADLKTASDPDTLFLQMMIPHHAMAVVQADTQMMYGSNQRLKQISESIISSQSRQIGEMENLLQRH